jgi:DNA-binding transcriptional LysR family regulator
MNISTRQLHAFLTLLEARNFTRAAATCHLSQPAFSALVRQLEDALGVRLFDRSTRHVSPTAEGLAFAPAARRLLAELDTALGDLQARAALQRGRVAVALLPSLAADWLPDVLAGFRQQHPGIELQVFDVLSEACIDQVQRGQADFALAAARADTPALRAEPFCTDGFHLVCPQDHPLTRRRSVQPKDLAGLPFIHLSRTSSVRQCIDAATGPGALGAVLEVDQLATVAGMVRAGLGVSAVPTLALYQFRGTGLALRPLRWPGLQRHIYLVRRRDRGFSVAAQGLYDWMMARRPGTSAGKAQG